MSESTAHPEVGTGSGTAVDLDDRVMIAPLVATGDDAVDTALTALGSLAERPVAEHVEVFEAVHRGLRIVLDDTAAG